MEYRQNLIDYILRELLVGQNLDQLSDDQDLLISGLVDSLGVIRMINYIEQTMEVSIPAEDVTLENFQTVENIVNYLQKHKS